VRFTHGSKPNNPKVSRSSKVNAAPLLRLGSFKSARPRRAVQIGRYSSRGRKKVSDGGGRNFLFGRQPPKKETRRNSRWGEQPREDVHPGERGGTEDLPRSSCDSRTLHCELSSPSCVHPVPLRLSPLLSTCSPARTKPGSPGELTQRRIESESTSERH
jgi:hypothetical protein